MPRIVPLLSNDPAERPWRLVRVLDSLVGCERTHRVVKASPGTIENIRKRRAKRVDFTLFEALREAAIHAMESRIRNLEDQIAMARVYNSHLTDDELADCAAQVDRLSALISKAPK